MPNALYEELIESRLSALLEKDEMSNEEIKEHNRLLAEKERLAREAEHADEKTKTKRRSQHDNPGNVSLTGVPQQDNERPADTWLDQNGRKVKMLAPNESYAGYMRAQQEDHGQPRPSIGKAIRAMVTGDWSQAKIEASAMDTRSGSGAHYLIPEEMSSEIIDLARAKTVCIQAGARTLPMGSDRLTIVKQLTDPSLEFKRENDAFTGDDGVTFGAISFTSHTIGQVVTMSRELMQDAPNSAYMIEQALAASLARKIDYLMLMGDGTSDLPLEGLISDSNVGSTTSVGAIDWLDLHNAVIDIQTNNGEPNAYICSPTIRGDLATLTSGDGTNAARMWLPAPATVQPLTALTTTACPDENAFVGDWSQAVFAVRQVGEIAVSYDANEAFERNQVKLRITWRGDIGFLRPTFFHRLEGITT